MLAVSWVFIIFAGSFREERMARIEHTGRVVEVTEETAVVEVERSGACVGCQAKSVCGSSERETQRVSVELTEGQRVEVGDEVKIVGRAGMGRKAVMIAYVVPTVLMVGMLMVGKEVMGWCDGVAGAVAIGVMVPYGLVMWLLRGRWSREFRFRIE